MSAPLLSSVPIALALIIGGCSTSTEIVSSTGEVSVGKRYMTALELLVCDNSDAYRKTEEGSYVPMSFEATEAMYRYVAIPRGQPGWTVVQRLGDNTGPFLLYEETYAKRIVCGIPVGSLLTIKEIRDVSGYSIKTGFGGSIWIYSKSADCNYLFSTMYIMGLVGPLDGRKEIEETRKKLKKLQLG